MPIKNSLFKAGFSALLLALLSLSGSAAAAPDAPYQLYLPVISKVEPSQSLPTSGSWLDWVNFYRGSASLPPVTENSTWSAGDTKHAIYTVKNNVLMHDEDTGNAWYTSEGQSAAKTSNIMASSSASYSDRSAVELWMRGPFHAVGILDPHLGVVGYGSYREADGGYQMAAALNVISGINSGLSAKYPVYFPGNGAFVPLTSYTGGESPDPLSSCSGYSVPAGLPLILQIGAWSNVPNVSAFSLSHNGSALEVCEFDQNNYQNSNSSTQSLGRQVLASRNAIVLVPRQPLVMGESYTASVTDKGILYTWTFRIASN